MTSLLELSSLSSAHAELVDALMYYNSPLAKQDKNLRRHLMAGTIQAFEFTYELTVKFIRRYLELTEPSIEFIASMTFPALIRTAHEKGLIQGDVVLWKQFRDKRNITNHTYDASKAEEVMLIIPDFIHHSQILLNALQIRIQE